MKKKSVFTKFIHGVERVGNRLPHPITLFSLFTLIMILLSALCAMLGLSATGEMIDPQTMEIRTQTVYAVSLLSREGIVYMLTSMVSNFTGFAPLGVVLVTMLGIGCAEGSGYLSALLQKMVSVTPRKIITPAIIFLGVMSNLATDIGYVILIPVGALVFMASGRHPMAGIAAAFAGVSGGFSANLMIGALDPLLAGISTEAAQILDPNYVVQPTANWFFMFVSTFLIVLLGTLVTDKFVEPRLNAASPMQLVQQQSSPEIQPLSRAQLKGLKAANGVFLLLVVVLIILTLPKGALLRNPQTGSLTNDSPLMNGLIVILAILFFVPSIVFGRISGVYRNEKEIARQLENNMSAMGGYIALIFFAAQLVNFFQYSNLGSILAMQGAELLKKSGFSGPVLMVLFILFTALINLVMGSSTAKWTILAPIFIPIFMLLGYSSELTQVAY